MRRRSKASRPEEDRSTPVQISEQGRLYEFVRKEVESGGQAYVVFPRVRGDDEAVSVEAGHAALQRGALRGLPVGMVHGGMPRAERARTG